MLLAWMAFSASLDSTGLPLRLGRIGSTVEPAIPRLVYEAIGFICGDGDRYSSGDCRSGGLLPVGLFGTLVSRGPARYGLLEMIRWTDFEVSNMSSRK